MGAKATLQCKFNKKGEIIMDEKVLIESEKLNIKKESLGKYFLYPFLAIYFFFLIYGGIISIHDGGGFTILFIFQAAFVSLFFYWPVLIVYLFIWFISKNQLVVTDKRISGKAAFGKQIDLPIDSISSVSTIKLIKGLSISTSSGNVSFWGIGNRDEVYKVISDLIIARQTKSYAKEEKTTNNSDYTEELKKIKDLLDAGVITQEEFDAKRKQILGL